MAEDQLTVDLDHSQVDEGIISARLIGEIDTATAPTLVGELQTAIFTGAPRELILDFGGVTFMDSSGLRVIIDIHNELRARDSLLALENVPATTRKLLEVTGMTDHLDIR
jgi:anti-anti-sigma factor